MLRHVKLEKLWIALAMTAGAVAIWMNRVRDSAEPRALTVVPGGAGTFMIVMATLWTLGSALWWLEVAQARRTTIEGWVIRQPRLFRPFTWNEVDTRQRRRIGARHGWDDPNLFFETPSGYVALRLDSLNPDTRRLIVALLRRAPE